MKKLSNLLGGSIFKSILSSYIIICGIILLGTMAGYVYNYRVLESNTESLAAQRAQIMAANFDKEFAQLYASMDYIASDRVLTKTLNSTEEEMGAQIHELGSLRELILNNIHRSTIREAYVYYNDTNLLFSISSRLWNSKVINSYIKNLGMEPEEFTKVTDFEGLRGGHIFSDGRVWLMENVYDDHYKKKAVIVLECHVSEIDIGEKPEDVTGLTNGNSEIYASDENLQKTAEDVMKDMGNNGISSDGYYYAYAGLSTIPWSCFVGTPKSSLFRSVRIFWLIFAIEFIGAIAIMLYMSYKSTTRLWKPLQELLDVINEKEDAGFMETFKGVNSKVSSIMSENSLMQRHVSTLEPYMYENRIRRVFDGDIKTESSVIKTFGEFMEANEGDKWSMIIVRPKDEKQGALLNVKASSPADNADKDIMSFTLKNIIDELTEKNDSRVYKCSDDYLIFMKIGSDNDRDILEEKLDEMRLFYSQTLREPIYILMGETYESFADVRTIYMTLKAELEYRIFWREGSDADSVWVMRTEQADEDMVNFDEYAETVRMMLNCLETGNFKEAYQMMDTYLSRAFPHNRRYLRQNIYRMYGLAAILTMSISYRMEKADKEFMESLEYEERLMTVTSMEELREISKELFSSIIDYMEEKEKDGIPAWMDDVQVYIQEHYTEQGFSVSGIADEYGFTVSHLSRTFKSVMGTGLLDYIQKLRVEKAKELLEEGASVNDAAVGSGYLDAKALTRAFKRYEGITPGAYRDSRK
ncbi:helix-turn-helix domain-containing protein [Butyrivibrio sp. AC2005]|uniref:helix-turn-helix domain-containing protein n=1 Tax=Butyrivibrio sp. AC2005 TaxID=1280672 RepID=UPI0003FB20BA|nr:AraC family transcriptional regulator [Butyrivibrio sp. AC2005]